MSDNRTYEAQKVTLIGSVVNLFLSILKIVVGVVGRSSAMLADGIHSLSDFVTDAVVLVFIRLSGKEADEEHMYGHGKFETLATVIIGVVLLLVAVAMGREAAMKIWDVCQGEVLPQPSMIAFWVALISIAAKEVLFQYSIRVGRRIESQSVIANSWHHRSDALSSIGTALGIAGAIFLGEHWRVLDPIAGLLVSLLIAKVAYQIAMPCLDELLERALPSETNEVIVQTIMAHSKVLDLHKLRTRRVGSLMFADVHVQMDKDMSFERVHAVTEELEHELRLKIGERLTVTIHPEPR